MNEFQAFLTHWLDEKRQRDRTWNVARLGRETGIAASLLSRWLGPDATTPGDANLRRLAPVVGVSHADLMRMVGRLGPSSPVADAEATDPELALRMRQLQARLAAYPRAFWSSVLAANDRMLEAGDALSTVGPDATQDGAISKQGRPRISKPVPPITGPSRRPGGELNAYSRPVAAR